jgi:hypothetical protein
VRPAASNCPPATAIPAQPTAPCSPPNRLTATSTAVADARFIRHVDFLKESRLVSIPRRLTPATLSIYVGDDDPRSSATSRATTAAPSPDPPPPR